MWIVLIGVFENHTKIHNIHSHLDVSVLKISFSKIDTLPGIMAMKHWSETVINIIQAHEKRRRKWTFFHRNWIKRAYFLYYWLPAGCRTLLIRKRYLINTVSKDRILFIFCRSRTASHLIRPHYYACIVMAIHLLFNNHNQARWKMCRSKWIYIYRNSTRAKIRMWISKKSQLGSKWAKEGDRESDVGNAWPKFKISLIQVKCVSCPV